jgi:hypothetical protein
MKAEAIYNMRVWRAWVRLGLVGVFRVWLGVLWSVIFSTFKLSLQFCLPNPDPYVTLAKVKRKIA